MKNQGGDPCRFPLEKGALPSGAQQTECVLQDGATNTMYGRRFVVQHNALKPQCGDNE